MLGTAWCLVRINRRPVKWPLSNERKAGLGEYASETAEARENSAYWIAGTVFCMSKKVKSV